MLTPSLCPAQYSPGEETTLKLRVGDSEIEEKGTLYTEATFIS